MIFPRRCYNCFEDAAETLLLVLFRGRSSVTSTFGLRLREDTEGFAGVAEREGLVFGTVGFRSAANTTAWHHPPNGPH